MRNHSTINACLVALALATVGPSNALAKSSGAAAKSTPSVNTTHATHTIHAPKSSGSAPRASGHTVTNLGRAGPVYIFRSGPAVDVNGYVVDTGQIPAQGDAPELATILSNPRASSELRYRAELCRVVGSHASQLACFNHR